MADLVPYLLRRTINWNWNRFVFDSRSKREKRTFSLKVDPDIFFYSETSVHTVSLSVSLVCLGEQIEKSDTFIFFVIKEI
jgi:hypothetical protein